MSYINLENVSVNLGGITILKQVTASFDKGMIHGIVGRNGSGKSIMFKVICGFVRATSGKVSVNGKRIGIDEDHPESLGMMINDSGFLRRYSGFRNLCFMARIRNTIGTDKIKKAIAQVGLDPDDRRPVAKYSTGMRQRLAIAQAIMEDPELLILDEPMNGLDDMGAEDIRKLLLELKSRNKVILLTSHNREDIETLCDTVYKMDAGVLTRLK